MKKAELEYMNNVLDRECQKMVRETNILKGIISNMLKGDEQEVRMFKISTPDPIHIKIEDEWCTITRGSIDATIEGQEEHRQEHQ